MCDRNCSLATANKLDCKLVYKLVCILVYKLVYVDQFVDYSVDEFVDQYVDQCVDKFIDLFLRRCQTTVAAADLCVEMDDTVRGLSHGSHSQGGLHWCTNWSINEYRHSMSGPASTSYT